MSQVSVQYGLARKGLPAASSVRRWVAAALAQQQQAGALCVRLVDESEGRELNRDWRGKDYATNVLSFPAELEIEQQRWLGDLVICAPVVAREAVEQNKASKDHCAHLTVHGVLHLLGYDHQDEAEALAMEALEVEILAQLGIANPYLQHGAGG